MIQSTPAVVYNATLNKTLVYIETMSNVLLALDASTGATVWSYTQASPTGGYASPTVYQNTVYVGGSGDHTMWAIDATTGALQCSFATTGRIFDGPVVADLGSGPEVFFGDTGLSETNNNGHEWAITGVGNSLGGCKLIWSFNSWGVTNGGTQTGSWSPPALAYDSTGRPLLVFGTSQPDSSVYALDARDGSMVWRYNTSTTGDHDVGAGACITAPGVNGFADGEVYIDGKDQVLYALDLMTGAVGWSFDLKAAIGVKVSNSVSTPACVGSMVYVGYGYGVWAFDAATGAEHWYSGTSSPVGVVVLSSPAVAGDGGDQVIYSNDGGGAATAYRLSDGSTLWHYLTSMPMYGSDAVSDGQVFFGGLDGNVYAFGPATGAISGIVTDASTQAAIAGATVSCTCSVSSATTDAGGGYSLPNLTPASDYSLTFSASGYATQTFDHVAVAAGATTREDAQLANGVGGMIAGTVTDATASGNPVLQGVTVTCTCEGGSQTTDASGQYTFGGVPGGSYSMTFSATGYVTQVIASVAVSPAATTTEDAALSEDGGISGTVTDAQTHAPISGATVACTCQGGSTSTNGSGMYGFTDVAPGTYTVSVSDAGYSSASNSGVVVSAGTSTVPDFALTANGHQVVFSDGFESGTLSAWTASKGLTIESTVVHSGSYAAEVKTTHGGGFARKTLPSTYAAGYGRVWFDIVSQSSQVNVLSLEAASGSAIASLYVTPSRQLGMSAGGTRTVSSTKLSHGTFHELELSVTVKGKSSTTQVWLDGTLVPALSRTINLGTSPIAQLQIGQAGGSGTYTVVFDDAAFDTALLP
jgi:outer membrane protein assembly factor BamB